MLKTCLPFKIEIFSLIVLEWIDRYYKNPTNSYIFISQISFNAVKIIFFLNRISYWPYVTALRFKCRISYESGKNDCLPSLHEYYGTEIKNKKISCMYVKYTPKRKISWWIILILYEKWMNKVFVFRRNLFFL